MIGDWIFLVFCVLASGYSMYAWREYADDDYLHFLMLGAVATLLLVTKIFLVGVLPTSIQQVARILIWLSWIPVIAALVMIGRKVKWK